MISLGHKDWIKYGYGIDLEDKFREDAPLILDFTSYKIPELIMTPIEASRFTICEIATHYPAPYKLLCSGGVDSQSMIMAWANNKIPFEVFSFRYYSNGIDFNNYDLIGLEDICKEKNVKITFIEFDIIHFLEVELPLISELYECYSPQICTHIKLSEYIGNGTIIYSGNSLFPSASTICHNQLGIHRYAMKTDSPYRKIIPFFFIHTPELAYSFMGQDPLLGEATYDAKVNAYIRAGFPIRRQIKKLNGFEKLKEYYDPMIDRISVRDRLRFSSRISKRPFDILFRYKLEDFGKNIDKLQCINKTCNITGEKI